MRLVEAVLRLLDAIGGLLHVLVLVDGVLDVLLGLLHVLLGLVDLLLRLVHALLCVLHAGVGLVEAILGVGDLLLGCGHLILLLRVLLGGCLVDRFLCLGDGLLGLLDRRDRGLVGHGRRGDGARDRHGCDRRCESLLVHIYLQCHLPIMGSGSSGNILRRFRQPLHVPPIRYRHHRHVVLSAVVWPHTLQITPDIAGRGQPLRPCRPNGRVLGLAATIAAGSPASRVTPDTR